MINFIFKLILIKSKETLYNFSENSGTNLIETLETEEGTYFFYDDIPNLSPYKIQHHLPYLIQSLAKLKEPMIYQLNSIKYEIHPFDEIFMHTKKNKISLGKYSKSFLKDNLYHQEYVCGSKCDLKKNEKRCSKVCFKGLTGELRVDSMVEKKLCNYFFTVGGEELARNIENCESIGYKFIPKNDKENTQDDKNKENKENEVEKEKEIVVDDVKKIDKEFPDLLKVFEELMQEKSDEEKTTL